MARGINQRLRLSLPYAAKPETQTQEIMRWANNLPFGSVGFEVYSNVSLTVANGATATIDFRRSNFDRENWCPNIKNVPQTIFKVPPGLSGLYFMQTQMYYSAYATNTYVGIRVNGNSVTNGTFSNTAGFERGIATTCHPVNDGDEITAYISNGSGVSITGAAIGRGANGDFMPLLRVWRISLL